MGAHGGTKLLIPQAWGQREEEKETRVPHALEKDGPSDL
jgi:hypothetical protein